MATASDPRLAQLDAAIREIRERVRARHPEGPTPGMALPLPDLLPLLHARDAAEAKVAAIGSVNPRRGGPVNAIIQSIKRQIARGLGWFVRDQIDFNRTTVTAIQAALEALTDVNRSLVAVGAKFGEADTLRAEAAELKDIRAHWGEWREGWEKRLHRNEAHFLRSVAELNLAMEKRLADADANYRGHLQGQHTDYLAALDRATREIQERLWADVTAIRLEYERLIHFELRVMRQRSQAPAPSFSQPSAPPAPSGGFTSFDYVKFAERFRGSEEYVRTGQQFFKPYFAGCKNVLDIGCGRGEFLEVMREAGVPASGIDLDNASVDMCLAKGLSAEVADLFAYLAGEGGRSFDGIFAGQIVEHLPADQLPGMVKLCAARLKPGGVFVIETPNPECLAIFASHFYIDPTHTRPVPSALLAFYFEEFGLGTIEVQRRFPATESMPELKSLPEEIQTRFFGGLDYAIIGRKL